MASAERVITVGLTPSATAISSTAAKIPATARGGRRVVLVQNLGPGAIYVGGSTVTTSNGIKISAGGEKSFAVADSVPLYAVSDGDSDVRTLEGE